MPRHVTCSPLWALLSGLLVSACSGGLEAGVAPDEELLGAQESALCAGTSVTSLTISGVSSYCGELAGAGSWAVASPANAVRLEYYVDGTLNVVDERTTASGTWNFSRTGLSCGTHTFLVKAWPMVIDSGGNRTTCFASPGKTASQNVTQPCPTATLSCTQSATSVTCTGTGSGGVAPHSAQWRTRTQAYGSSSSSYSSWSQGTWTKSFNCIKTTSSVSDKLWIEHKAKDSCPLESPVLSSLSFLCEPTWSCSVPNCDALHGTSCQSGTTQCAFSNSTCTPYNCLCSGSQWMCP